MLTDKEKSLFKIQTTILSISMLNTQMLTYLVFPQQNQPENHLLRITEHIERNNEIMKACIVEINKLLQDSDDSDFLSSFKIPLN